MKISLERLRAGGSCYTVEEVENGFLLHVVSGDEANFNIIVRRLLDEGGDAFVVFPRTDGQGGYDCVHVLPLETSHERLTSAAETSKPRA